MREQSTEAGFSAKVALQGASPRTNPTGTRRLSSLLHSGQAGTMAGDRKSAVEAQRLERAPLHKAVWEDFLARWCLNGFCR